VGRFWPEPQLIIIYFGRLRKGEIAGAAEAAFLMWLMPYCALVFNSKSWPWRRQEPLPDACIGREGVPDRA